MMGNGGRTKTVLLFPPPFVDAAMAAKGVLKKLYEAACCSICLDYFRDRVTFTKCSHTFCRACPTQSWENFRAKPSCPLCSGRVNKKKHCPNELVANIVEVIQRVCQEHWEPLQFFCQLDKDPLCVDCSTSQKHSTKITR